MVPLPFLDHISSLLVRHHLNFPHLHPRNLHRKKSRKSVDGKQSAHLGPQPHSPFRLGAEVRSLSTTTRWKLVCSAGYDMKNTLTYHVKVCTSDWHIIERWRVTEMSWKTAEKHRNIRYHDLSMEISEFGRALFWDSPTSMKMRYHGIKKVGCMSWKDHETPQAIWSRWVCLKPAEENHQLIPGLMAICNFEILWILMWTKKVLKRCTDDFGGMAFAASPKVEGSIEVKLSTIWRDRKAEWNSQGGEAKKWEDQRRERGRSKKMQVRKGRKVTIHCVFPMIWGSGGSKSNLAKAAGAEPAGQMRDEKLHAVVARSTFPSQNAHNTPTSDHVWELRCRKSVPLWLEAHFQVKMYRT